MNTSRSLARLIGPILLVIGIGMAFGLMMEGAGYSSVLKEFIANRALIFLTGILALLAGVAIINVHNVWVPDWRVIVTVLGWLLVLRGVMLLVFPLTVQVFGDRVATSQAGVTAGAALTFVLGAILCIMGYEHLWAGKPRRAARAASAGTRRSRRPRRKRA
ncbi:MAG TPA: hypothetical protein VKD02_07130 [Methyloceanibacter sp.]|nr:hypothetical protein [Methyloceanibacter sp.]